MGLCMEPVDVRGWVVERKRRRGVYEPLDQ